MGPASPIVLAEIELADAFRQLEELRQANQDVIHMLSHAENSVTVSEENMADDSIEFGLRQQIYWEAYAAYDAARGVYMDVFGVANQRVATARDNLDNLL